METWVVSVNLTGESRIVEYRVKADSAEQAAFQGGLAACFEFVGNVGLAEIIAYAEIVFVQLVTETRKTVWTV